jgi:Uma2 family endonuclease
MEFSMVVTAKTFEQVALEDPDGQWELDHGCLRRKPQMTLDHDSAEQLLTARLIKQLDESDYRVYMNTGRLGVSTGSFYIPDVTVIPASYIRQARRERGGNRLQIFNDPVPLVVEVWSPSTGEYDVEAKLREYQPRRDEEIWRLHPYDHTLTAWRLQPDGTYTETVYTHGIVELHALPGVSIDFDALFD